MPLGMEVGLGPARIVFDGHPFPPKEAQPPFNFRPMFVVAKRLVLVPLGTEVGLSQGDIVLDGDPGPPQKGGTATQFLPHVYCGQTVGWITMPFGMEVGLSPGYIVLYGDPASPSPKDGHSSPQFLAYVCCG